MPLLEVSVVSRNCFAYVQMDQVISWQPLLAKPFSLLQVLM